MIPLVIATAALAVIYGVWRLRFGYPSRHTPQVLCFHKISRRFLFEGTWTTPHRFAVTIDRLLDLGYRFVDEDTYLRSLASPPAHVDRTLFLTFDDGYDDVFTEVFPLLVQRSIPFHIFVVSDYCGAENDWDLSLGRRAYRHASWEQLREMIDAGATVGSHTASHPDLTRVTPGRLFDEMRRSKEVIAERLGAPARTISYPFGRYSQDVMEMAKEVGYEAGFSLYPRHHNSSVERYSLRRNGVYVIDAPRWVAHKLDRNAWFWLEEMKCRAINSVAVLTPLLKRSGRPVPGRDTANRNEPGSKTATG